MHSGLFQGMVLPESAGTGEMPYLFLDTEWADEEGDELVSLALISADGLSSFYAERCHLPSMPSEFARPVVYPLLAGGSYALTDLELEVRLREFLSYFRDPFVLFDFPNDGRLFKRAWGTYGTFESDSTVSPSLTLMIREGKFSEYFEGFFRDDPVARARRHHALVDAMALRAAWLRVTGRTEMI